MKPKNKERKRRRRSSWVTTGPDERSLTSCSLIGRRSTGVCSGWPLTSANHLFSVLFFWKLCCVSNRLQMILHLMSLLFYFHQIFCFFLLFVFGSYFPPFLLFSSVPGDLWENLQALVFSHRSGGQSRAPPAGGAGKRPFIHFCFSLPLKEESQ